MRVILLALAIVSIIACNRNLVNLEYTNARDEVPRLGNLVFRFSDQLMPDSLLNEWDSTAYVKFSPNIPGRFRWENPHELIFSPSQPLPPATSFKARFSDDLTAASKYTSVASDEIEFHTAALKLEDVQVTWINPGDKPATASPQIDLYFNYPVAPEQLKNKLKIEVEGTNVPYNISTLSEKSRISVVLQNTKAIDKDLQGKIFISAGVLPQGGTNSTANDIASSYTVPSPFNLIINNLNAEHDGLTGTVSVLTSQQLLSNNIASLITVEPAVKFSVQNTDEGFVLKSDEFNAEQSYRLTIKKGVQGRIGGVLQEQYENNIAFGEMEPTVNFTSNKSVYLAAHGNRMVEVRIVNVPKVKVVISKVYESNLLAARNFGYEPRETRSGDDNNYYEYYSEGLSMGDVIFEKEIDTRSLPQSGNSRLFSFNVEDRLPDFRGIYHIRVRSMQNYWISDSRFVSVSDVGLIAKEGRDKLYVFANSLQSAQPLQNVNIVAYGNNNQVLGLAATNADGVAEITYTRKEFAGFKPAMVVAKSENDFNYLPFNSSRVNLSRFETGGKRGNSTGLDGFIYPERDVYRPGERINFSVIVRDANWKSPGELPLRFRLLLPNGKEYRVFRKTLNEQGSTEGQVDISTAAITGTYTLEVYTSNDVLIGTQTFSIEEFVPDRIRVSPKLNKSSFTAGETAVLAIDAVNFFGPPAAGRNYEAEIQLKARDFAPKKYKQFLFGIKNKGVSLDKVVREGKLDQQGRAEEKYEVPAMFTNNGLLQADFYTTVFDETGRPVSRSVKADVFTQQVFLGLGDDGYWYYPLNQQMRVPVIAIDKSERVVNANAMVRVIKREYRTVLSKAGEYFRYESQEEDKIISEQTIAVSGEHSTFSFVPRSPGNYEIRVSLPGAAAYVSRTFYSYGTWGGDNNSFEVNTDGNIDIETDKSVYRPGEKAKVLFKSPFNGKMLVSVEQDKVISYQYVDVENKMASVDFPISEEHLPNIFVTATLIKPHSVSDIPLTVAHGFQNVKVEDARRLNKVEIVATKTTRSKTRQQITVKASPNSYVTLAAVDNGVLQVTDFKTPDPYNYFYSSRALQVDAYDLYPLLFPEIRARLSSTGGDAEMSMQKRVNPMPAKRVQVVSYWSGITKANGNGQANFTIDVPRFSGQLRLMAVAYRDNSFGSAESVITVADPIVVSTGLPRFLSPGDSLIVPVTLTNTTRAATNADVTMKTSGPVKVSGETTRTVTLAPEGESRVVFTAGASSAIDTGRIIIDVKAGSERTGEEIAIGVRPASPLLIMNSSGIVEGGKSLDIPGFQNDFLNGTASYKLTLSRSPVLELGEQLRYLVRYPYGCTEQVISAAFPQLYYGEIAAHVSGNRTNNNANQNVIEAIRKIKLRQLYNGALTLWDNEGTENWWTTIYAAHFLIEAKKAGFDVDESLISTMLSYINNRLRNKQTVIYYYNRNQKKKIAPKEVAYSLYVLSLASRPNISAMNYYKANVSVLSLDSKYLLGASYAIAGDRKKFAELLPVSFSGEESVPETGGSFYSPIRDEAIALNALIEVDPKNSQIPVMARHVAMQLKNREWYSTQECAFSFLALGKLAKSIGGGSVTAEVRSNGKVVAAFKDREVTYSSKQINNLQVTTKGEGRLFYYLQAEGISKTGQYKEEDSYIKVRRQFFDRFGNRIDKNNFKRNELVVVQVTLDRLFNSPIQNIVITDLLPAGFEIENPRTKEIPGMDWINNASVPTQLDMRDDRIHLFVDLTENRQVYYYAVRAVSLGKFRVGPIGADALYNGEYHSYHGAGTIEINE